MMHRFLLSHFSLFLFCSVMLCIVTSLYPYFKFFALFCVYISPRYFFLYDVTILVLDEAIVK